jgi:hypothetical protein
VEIWGVGDAVVVAGHVGGEGVFDRVPIVGTLDAGAGEVWDAIAVHPVGGHIAEFVWVSGWLLEGWKERNVVCRRWK